ncbi:MAG: hypothetical protein LBT97_14080, partial [Planctomycetota bacterium]|nr:hypothetical protein [Planctomycetota bacterium]
MTMRVLALMVAAGMLLSVLGCGLAETGAAPRRRGIFQGRRAKRGDSDATAAGYADKRWPAAAGDGDDNIRRDLAKLRAAEDAQDRRIRELRSGISEGESAVAREEEKLDAIRGRIERYEVALGERSETPSRAYRQRGRDTVGGVPAYPERGETAERWNATPYARGGMGDEAALSPPRAYDSPPRAQVRNIPDSRRQLNGGEVLVWQPPASPFAYRSGADASGSRRFPFMAAPSFPSPDRSARRPEPPAAPSYPPALPAAGVPDISQERREMGVSS